MSKLSKEEKKKKWEEQPGFQPADCADSKNDTWEQ